MGTETEVLERDRVRERGFPPRSRAGDLSPIDRRPWLHGKRVPWLYIHLTVVDGIGDLLIIREPPKLDPIELSVDRLTMIDEQEEDEKGLAQQRTSFLFPPGDGIFPGWGALAERYSLLHSFDKSHHPR
jgi:hypothetical protein